MRVKWSNVSVWLLLVGLASGCLAETMIVEAKIIQKDGRGFVLQLPSGPLAVEDDSKTKCWLAKTAAVRESFKEGDVVTVRVKSDSDPPVLREIADRDTWKWLEGVRKQPQKAQVEAKDARTITVKFPDGSRFTYRATDKSEVHLEAKADASLADVTPGMTVWVKGRTLPSLDTWLVVISDRPIAASTSGKSTTKQSGTVKRPQLPAAGTLEAMVVGLVPKLNMFDVEESRRVLHITYSAETKFLLAGKPSNVQALTKGSRCTIAYKRDKQGRILASKVEWSAP